ncbi:uncharacterized protein PV09_03951 [Verruconis gallopava]|uniref:Fe2OG dioxygenase domain-containing protein n=1 Tax=Verruconis gallopava TaxID=253628 RepID=A0A0D1YVM8_9PEZI|nr:uncharacterized protein PV09_03951 [Verruconis gallopava]KIW04757.1 hypothetical protein PV09_03951 [Verruconis gallopava]
MVALTPEQICLYRLQGYIILRANVHDLVKESELKIWTDEVANWPHYHAQIAKLLYGQELANILQLLSGREMQLFKAKINYKLPKGNGFHAHLDGPAYDHICKTEHVTANFAVDPADLENGCLEVVPGSHKMMVELADGGPISDDWIAKHDWVPVPLNPGDILFFGSHLAHKSGPDRTKNRRASLYATFSGKADGENLREKYYIHRRMVFQPDHEREEGKGYDDGWKTYGFAAPFSKPKVDEPANAIVTH